MAIAPPIPPAPAIERHGMFVKGQTLATEKYDEVRLPFDGSVVAQVAHAEPAQVQQAIDAAAAAAPVMAEWTNSQRADLLMRIAALVREDADMLAHLITVESGKPIKEGRLEAQRAGDTLIAAAHEARALHGEVVPMDFAASGKGRMAMTVREPVGVVAAITPFNFPLNLALHKIAPAFAAGNTVVHKPAERTPLSALRLAELIAQADAPAGAYNVITGDGPQLANLLLESPQVAMLTFTGSRKVGGELRAKAGWKKITLELGNNSAVIIEPDADLDKAVERCVAGGFTHSGQVCISVQRVFVHSEVMERFARAMAEATGKLRIGHPLEDSTAVSSLIDEAAAKRVEQWIGEAVSSGAQLLCGGERHNTTVDPTVLLNVPPDARISCEEVFGPVVALYPYESLDDAIQRANNTPYGLQAGIFTCDITRAFSAARRLHFGGVMINEVAAFRLDHMPYGGMKESGMGREGPRYAIEEMTDLKLICWKTE